MKNIEKLEIVYFPVGDLIPYDKNPRKNDQAVPLVKASIEKFGFKVPIVVDENKVVVCGHTRLLAAKEIGLDEVPCIMASDLTPEQIRAFRIADNKVAEAAEWDLDLLKDEIAELPDFDFGDFGFTDDDLSGEEEKEDDDYTAYTGKLDVPQYQPADEMPAPNELANREKADNLVAEINAAPDIPEDIREFLRLAAMRHVVFDYKKIADFYAAADENIQELMEKSALVIIDYDDAIKNGFVRHSEKLEAIAKGIFDAKRDE